MQKDYKRLDKNVGDVEILQTLIQKLKVNEYYQFNLEKCRQPHFSDLVK